jgi:hypothetical protein
MSKKLELLKEAIFNNEFFEFIVGSNKKYYLACPYAEMPTDPDQVFDAIKEYYKVSNDQNIWLSFEKGMIKLNETSQGAWFSIYYLSMYLSYKKYTGKNFIDLSSLIQTIENGLNRFQSELHENKNWVGYDFENGLWGDANRLINILIKKFEIKINLNNSN